MKDYPKSLTEAFEKLEQITHDLEQEDLDLEEGIPKFKEGLLLARCLKKRLAEIENEVEKVKAEFKDQK